MKSVEQTYYSCCLQADLAGALKTVLRANRNDPKKLKILRKKVVARFVDKSESLRLRCDDKFVRDVILAYRNYYRKALLNPKKISNFNFELSKNLNEILQVAGINTDSTPKQEKIESRLVAEFKKKGYFALLGTISPFRSLLIWKKESSKMYTVSLPERKQKVRVKFLEQFLELSWLHYATFGKYYVGGWAKKDALYCVKQAYQVGSSKFKVHYLSHEAQHLADYKSYPALKQVDLEYRAKLAELSLTENPKKFIKKLELEAKDDKGIPHCYAAYKILEELNSNHSAINANERAKELLIEHSRKLKKLGSRICSGIL